MLALIFLTRSLAMVRSDTSHRDRSVLLVYNSLKQRGTS